MLLQGHHFGGGVLALGAYAPDMFFKIEQIGKHFKKSETNWAQT